MQNNPTWMPVVAAAITDDRGRLLMHRRPAGKDHAGLWEFPGGKVESGEKPAEALVREISEELSLELDLAGLEPAGFAQNNDSAAPSQIVILLYRCTKWDGVPQSMEGNEWGWFSRKDAAALPKPPLDVILLEQLAE